MQFLLLSVVVHGLKYEYINKIKDTTNNKKGLHLKEKLTISFYARHNTF